MSESKMRVAIDCEHPMHDRIVVWIGSVRSVRVGLVFLAIWGAMGLAVIIAAAAALMT